MKKTSALVAICLLVLIGSFASASAEKVVCQTAVSVSDQSTFNFGTPIKEDQISTTGLFASNVFGQYEISAGKGADGLTIFVDHIIGDGQKLRLAESRTMDVKPLEQIVQLHAKYSGKIDGKEFNTLSAWCHLE